MKRQRGFSIFIATFTITFGLHFVSEKAIALEQHSDTACGNLTAAEGCYDELLDDCEDEGGIDHWWIDSIIKVSDRKCPKWCKLGCFKVTCSAVCNGDFQFQTEIHRQ